MKTLGYYNGNFGPLDEMTVPMNDRACYFGDGVYEATLAKNGKIFALREHLDRFFNSAGLLKLKIPYTKEEIAQILYDMLAEMDDSEIFIYWQMTRGTGMRQHQFPDGDVKPNFWITMKPGKHGDMTKGLKLTTTEDTRFLHCNIKTLNLIPSVIAYQRCMESGCQETIFHRGDRVTECAHSNVLMIKDGVLCTPPRDNLILPGITLKHLLELAQANGIPTKEAPFTMDELRDADEIIISSSGGLCIQAVELDGKPVGGKDPATLKKLQDAYTEFYDKDTNY